MHLRCIIKAAACATLALAITGTAAVARDLSGKEIKIGAIVPSSGHFAEWGRGNTVALKLLEKQINENGGINGGKLRIVIYDDAAKPAQSASALRKLAGDEGVLAVAGPATSSCAEVVFPVANQLGIVATSQNSSKPGVAAANRPWVFRNTIDEAKLAKTTVPYFVKTYGVKNVAIIYDAKDATAAAVGTKIMPAAMAAAGVEVLNLDDLLSFNTGDLDVSAQVTKLRSLNPEGVVVSADYSQAITVIREMKRQGMTTPIVGSTQLISSAILQTAPDIPIVAPTNFFAGLETESAKAFVTKVTPLMRAEGNLPENVEPSMYDANIYEIVRIYIEAVKNADVSADPDDLAEDRIKIRDYVAKLKGFEGFGGPISFASDGDAVKGFFIVEAKDGAWSTKLRGCSDPTPGACDS